MTTYVLVGGAWIGAWAWKDVATRLRARGHEVYPLSMTGLGDRKHLASRSVDLETHIADVVSTFESEDLHDVVLVAHSYGMMPVTGAADRIPERIGRLVYVDSGPIPGGMAFIDPYSDAQRALVERLVAEQGDGWRFPLPSWDDLRSVMGASLEGISEEQLALFRARAVPHPMGTYRQVLQRPSAPAIPLPKLGVLCSFSEAEIRQLIASGHPWGQGMAGPEWQFVELKTSHWPMFSEPAALTEILDDAGRQ
jgi:pimeloyl-ACP methyl ester carboxylesterase